VTDAAGQTTTTTYNAAGQVLSVTNAKSETTTVTYDSEGWVQSVTGPVSGATTSYTYDSYGRRRTVTDSDGYVLTTDYDAFDRQVRMTYPDASYEEMTYDRLDLSTRRDRAGRLTRYYYDPLRRLVATRDPLGRVIGQEWCACGSMDGLVDAKGNRTRWERDLQGRVTREVRADGVTATTYTYGAASGRLVTTTDPKEQVTTYTYALDDVLLSTAYTNAEIATPTVNYTYDTQYGRLATMTDGTGVTTYAYHPAGGFGAGQVASVDGPLTDDTITYSYDELGRVTTRAINSVSVTWAFDALGRVTSEVNALGTFGYTYDGVSGRVDGVTYPNQQTSTYSYFTNAGDRRLETIHHHYPGGATLSRFDYTYDNVGNILTWRQQADATAVLWAYGYDAADQLTWAVKKTTHAMPIVLKTYVYAYDPAGNRTSEQIDDQLTGATYDVLNRLASQQPAGAMVVEGTVNEPATVTIQGKAAVITPEGRFTIMTPVVDGTSTLTIAATDPSANTATQQYEVDSTGTSRTLTYDANGNLISDGTRTIEWDARNVLHSMTTGTHRVELEYGNGGFVRLREFTEGTITGGHVVLFSGVTAIQERSLSDAVNSDFTAFGEVRDSSDAFYVRDHLRSPRATSDGTGSVSSRIDYDPVGRRIGPSLAIGFAGLIPLDTTSDTLLSLSRVYDTFTGRWNGPDPLGDDDGPNRYTYVSNNPIRWVDPEGLSKRAPECWEAMSRAATAFNGASNPRRNHCVASCLISRHCGGGPSAAGVAGLGKEAGDVLDCLSRRKKESCDTAFQPSDLLDNAIGIACPFWKSCTDWCTRRLPSGDTGLKGPLSGMGGK
jgi:RHS repeat-associated protein